MPRPRKENLDYFPFDVDFFSDKKIKILKAKFGADGIAVYLYILCEIYHKGYYIECDEDFILVMSDYFNFSENKTMQILNYLFNRSLLVSILVESVKVVTAVSVQRRYQAAKKASIKKREGVFERDVFVDERIWLLKKEETEPPIKVQSFDGFPKKNDSYSKENDNKSEKNDTKESKVNKSKGKESKVCSKFEIPCKNGVFIVDEDYYNELAHTYPDMDIDKCFQKILHFSANPQKRLDWNDTKNRIGNWLFDDNEAGKYRKKKLSGYPATYDIAEYESSGVILDDLDLDNEPVKNTDEEEQTEVNLYDSATLGLVRLLEKVSLSKNEMLHELKVFKEYCFNHNLAYSAYKVQLDYFFDKFHCEGVTEN